jgi:hypothetical protein
VTSRGGKGFAAVKRTSFTRVIPSDIELVDWEKVEGGDGPRRNGEQAKLFE